MRNCLLVLLFLAPALSMAQSLKRHPTGEFVTVLGNKIWVESAGTGQPIVLIPGGGGGSHDYFHPSFTPLEKSLRVIYYDGFGRGKSDKAKSPAEYTFDHDVEELEALRQALHLGKIIVYGHSYGGFVAQAYALKHPNSVSELIVSNIFTCAADYQASDDYFNQQVQTFLPELWANIAPLRAKGYLSNSPELQAVYLDHIQALNSLFTFYNSEKGSEVIWDDAFFNPAEYYQLIGPDADFVIGGDVAKLDFRPQLSSIKVPFLVMAGRRDGVVLPRLSMEFKKYAPQAKFVMFEKSGHYPFIEEQTRYLDTIRDFTK